MCAFVTVSVTVLIGFIASAQVGLAEQHLLSDVKIQHKRQLGADLCYIPSPLENGQYFPHERRCPASDNSASCQLVESTPVSVGWVIRYTCSLGYQLNTTRIASICLRRQGGAQWLPPLPKCVEQSYSSRFLPSKNMCGHPSRIHRVKRKIDGKISQRGAWPWMVAFGHNKTGNQGDGIHWFCAGTLITTRHILTAANCVGLHRSRPFFIARMDDLNLNDAVRDGTQPLDVGVDKKNIIVHPGFQKDVVFSHNIALVKLKSELITTDFVKPICLPTPDFKERAFLGETVYLASWGQTDDDRERNPKRRSRFEPVLHEISARIIDEEICNKNYSFYQSTDTPVIISDKIICATVDINKSCQGDIGSPLMLKYKGTYYLLGIVATEYGCFDDYFPRLFTKLSMYMDWLVANLEY